MRPCLALLVGTLVSVPAVLNAQAESATGGVAARSLAIPAAMSCSAACPSGMLLAPVAKGSPLAPQEQGRTRSDVGSGLAYGAAIGGIIGGLGIATSTLWDNQESPPSWWVALAAPIVGGLVGAGIGMLF